MTDKDTETEVQKPQEEKESESQSSDTENEITSTDESLSERFMKRQIQKLDDETWKEKYSDDLETVDRAHDELFSTYYETTKTGIVMTLAIIASLLITDAFFQLHVLIYGLSMNILGTVFLIRPSLRGRFQIAKLSEDTDPAIKREIEADRMVYTNIGFGILISGFILQLVSFQLIGGDELIDLNYFDSSVPDGMTIVVLLLLFYLTIEVSQKLE